MKKSKDELTVLICPSEEQSKKAFDKKIRKIQGTDIEDFEELWDLAIEWCSKTMINKTAKYFK